jgi:hypothetical protein
MNIKKMVQTGVLYIKLYNAYTNLLFRYVK